MSTYIQSTRLITRQQKQIIHYFKFYFSRIRFSDFQNVISQSNPASSFSQYSSISTIHLRISVSFQKLIYFNFNNLDKQTSRALLSFPIYSTFNHINVLLSYQFRYYGNDENFLIKISDFSLAIEIRSQQAIHRVSF